MACDGFDAAAQPFIRPVIKGVAKPADVKRRCYQNIADAMAGDFGRMAWARI